MNLYFHITKTGNLFHFISNLTNWHFSVRPSYKKYWLEKTGGLTSDDKKWLKKAEKLFQKYAFSNNNWGMVFLRRPENDVWKVAKNTFGKKDTEKFKEIYDYFLPRFDKIWSDERKLISLWKKELQETLSTFAPKELANDLNNLFNVVPDFSYDIKVILLMSSPTQIGGGANVGRGAITLEGSNMSPEKNVHSKLIFWHELIHVYWEKNNEYMNMLNLYMNKANINSFSKDIPAKIVLKEAVMESLIPFGYLSQKHLAFNGKAYVSEKIKVLKSKGKTTKSMSYWRYYSLTRMFDTAKKYVTNQKAIDEKYFDKVVETLEEFKKDPMIVHHLS